MRGAGATARDKRSVWAAISIVAVAVLAHVVLVAGVVLSSGSLDQDEVTSQLAASGHLDDWPPAVTDGGQWVRAADLHRFLEIDDGSSLAETQSNLRASDLHPPLYFWGILGIRSAGMDLLWSGPALNLAAVLLAAAIMYVLLFEELARRLPAALGTAVFLVSPGLIKATAFTRQYALLMLIGTMLLWVISRWLRPGPLRWLLPALFVVALLGILTVTQFVFALLGAVIVLTLRWWRADVRRIAWAVGTLVMSGAAALAIHPGYFEQYDELNRMIARTPPTSTTVRIQNWVDGFSSFAVLGSATLRAVMLFTFVVATLMILLLAWRQEPTPARRDARTTGSHRAVRWIDASPVVAAAAAVGGVSVAGATAAYVLGRTPAHAAGARYIVFLWPAIVLVGTAIVGRRLARPTVVLAVTAGLLLVSSLAWVAVSTDDLAPQRRAIAAVGEATVVVTDCLRRDTTPGATWWAPAATPFLLPEPTSRHQPPPVPPGTDRSRAVLLHTELCPTQNKDYAGSLLRQLGFARGGRIGPIAKVTVYRLEPVASPAPTATEPTS